MGLETGTYVNDLVATNPIGGDPKSEGDDHLRLLKSTLQATFPGMAGAAFRVQAKSAGYTVVKNDNTSLFDCTSGPTLSLTAAATLGNGHMFAVYANGADVTIDPNGAETINGASTLVVSNGAMALVFCSGTAFIASAVAVDAARTWSALQTFKDTAFEVVDNGDTSKKLQLQISGLTTSTTRTLTVQDKSGTIACLDDTYGKEPIWIPAGAWTPQVTNGPSRGSVELATNKQVLSTLDFDSATAEYAQFSFRAPKAWNESTVTYQPLWSHPATTTNFGVAWQLEALCVSDGDANDAAWGTGVVVTDTGGTTSTNYAGAESSAVTAAGTPVEGDLVRLRISRQPANGSDTMAVDARLEGVMLWLTTNASTDA